MKRTVKGIVSTVVDKNGTSQDETMSNIEKKSTLQPYPLSSYACMAEGVSQSIQHR